MNFQSGSTCGRARSRADPPADFPLHLYCPRFLAAPLSGTFGISVSHFPVLSFLFAASVSALVCVFSFVAASRSFSLGFFFPCLALSFWDFSRFCCLLALRLLRKLLFLGVWGFRLDFQRNPVCSHARSTCFYVHLCSCLELSGISISHVLLLFFVFSICLRLAILLLCLFRFLRPSFSLSLSLGLVLSSTRFLAV